MNLDVARSSASIFDPQRLRIARQLRKMSRADLATQVDVSAAAVGQWEAGEVRPKAESLLEISRALRFPVPYFASSGRILPSLDSDASFFRSLRKSRQVDRDAAMAHAALIAELLEVIERHARLPEFDIPEYPVESDAPLEEIDSIARKVRQHWELGDQPIDDVVREIERHGAVAARLPLADDGIDAFSWPAPERPVVILGIDKGDRARSRFDAAHELGHLVMHRRHPAAADRDLERQAHRFASAFLLPPEALEEEWPHGRMSWRELMHLKQRWQVSLAALLYRAREDGLINATSYESAIKYMSRAGWRKNEPGDLGAPERPRLLRRAAEMLEAAGIDVEALAQEASLPLDEVRGYLTVPGEHTRVTVDL